MKIDWKQKLSSRKFWAAAAGFVTAVTAIFGIDSMSAGQITAVISAIGVLAAYIIGESCVDASRSSEAAEGDAESGTEAAESNQEDGNQ